MSERLSLLRGCNPCEACLMLSTQPGLCQATGLAKVMVISHFLTGLGCLEGKP